MIYTLTTNPAIDLCVTSDELKLGGKTTRTKNAVYSANGKGINVSRALKYFGVESKILGFFGGFSGEFILSECEKEGLKSNPVMVSGITRINTSVSLPDDEIKLAGDGPRVTKENLDELLNLIENLADCDMLVIGGSSALGMPDSFYEDILAVCLKKGIKTVIDISSPNLAKLLKYKPYLIKPNDEELMDIFELSVKTEEDAINSLKKLYSMGAQNVLVTMGGEGSYFYDGKNAYFASPKKVKPVSSTCAGDSYLAAFLSEYKGEATIEKALKKANATGANVAESLGMGDFSRVDDYSLEVKVKKL